MSDNGINLKQVEDFGERLVGMLNEGALAQMLSIGHQTGLLDKMAAMPPATSGQIATAAELNERYVREWLNALTVGSIVTYNPEQKTYQLPTEHAQLLTRAAGADNMAIYMQHIASLGAVESQIVDCFYKGGGVPYESFGRFHEIMAEDSSVNVVAALTGQILPLVPGLVTKLEAGSRVLDVGCGRGWAINIMAQAFPQSHFIGCDLSEEAITFARNKAAELGISNASFYMQDMTTLADSGQYDLITAFDAIHDQAFPERVLGNIQRALKADGVFLMQDIAASSQVQHNLNLPVAPFLYTISTMHCMTVSLAQGGVGLGTMWGREMALHLLANTGFRNVSVQQLPHDFMNDYYIGYPDK